MWVELKALLHRYFITYFRQKGRLINEFALAVFIAISLIIRTDSNSTFGLIAQSLYYATIPFTFLIPIRSMLGDIVSEKSSGVKEYLKLNGLSTFNYQLYCACFTLIKILVFIGIILIGEFISERITPPLPDSLSFGHLVQIYASSAVATVSLILFLSTFFSDPKMASNVGGILYIVIPLISSLVGIKRNLFSFYIVCLFPPTPFMAAVVLGEGKDWPPEFGLQNAQTMILVDIVVFFVLYLYLDNVLPDENGVTKSLFFCLKCQKRRAAARELPAIHQNLINDSQPDTLISLQKDASSALYHEELPELSALKRAVEIKSITKNFGDCTAVDGISFSIYEGQVFCLLGQNGAGKTTAIRMLTGLIEMDDGEVYYDDVNFYDNMEEARTKIGICTQNDILFEKLKVREHLELIAKLRKVDTARVAEVVDEALKKLNLVDERERFSEELSGGNKRKLSLAMAVLGDTKVIFLDEPTSGMDPQNRRVMWHHLKQLKEQGLTILLTTHHLDEADELSDRIAIMSRGRLLALGTSNFFKKKFGVGYNLSLTPVFDSTSVAEFQEMKPKLKELISQIIPAVRFDDQTSSDVLKSTIPFTAQKDFSNLFRELENNPNIRINVEMNTLEDVFVNIGISEEKLLQNNADSLEEIKYVQPPDCLCERPTYNFKDQTLALAKIRAYLLFRSTRSIVMLLLPFSLLIVGILVSLAFRSEYTFHFFQYILLGSYFLHTGFFTSLPVFDREYRLKYLMDVMGLRLLPYWVGNYIVDCIAMTLMNVVAYAIYCIYYPFRDNPFHEFRFIQIGLSIFFHGCALIAICYTYSFAFKSSLSAIKYFSMIYFFILFMIGLGACGILQIFASRYKSPILYVFAAIVGTVCPTIAFTYDFLPKIASEEINGIFAVEFLYAAFYFGLAFWLSARRQKTTKKDPSTGWSVPESQEIPIEVADIEAEKERATAQSDPVKAIDLYKIYDSGLMAVRGISFGVEPGQIFGLLGPNGAGKSTTFNVLSAATPKSLGSAQLFGQEIHNNMPEVYENVGVCPQFNGLWEWLTVREHLVLFGNLKGLKGEKLEAIINYYLDVLQLRKYINKKSKDLSGGNKRKLCVANAFIGAANLIFLDEPSTGVDPLARKYLWNSIQQVLAMRKASIVLTTHSMYEAESLSHKIGILINGRFVCMGPTQHLKNKYSQGYKITVSLVPNAEDPMNTILESFPGASKLQEASSIQQTYHIPYEGFKFSQAFDQLEELKEKGSIKDFSIYNTTLEQIFIYFSRFQINL